MSQNSEFKQTPDAPLPDDDPRLSAQIKQRIEELEEDIKAPIPENDSLGYPLSPKIKKSEQFYHDACERIRALIRFCLADEKEQFERDGVLDWMIRIPSLYARGTA